MAPIALDDDFVLTISDNDDNVPDFEDIEESSPQNKKRKRGAENQANGISKKEKNKKRKRGQQVAEPVKPVNAVQDDAEEQSWAAGGEDDGAMASDFEFQVGDDEGVTEDFDGWGLGKEDEGKEKRGVDIEDIIARRREKEGRIKQKNAEAADFESLSEDEEKLGEDEDEEAEFDGFEEDETLAEDGFGMGAVDEDEESDKDAESGAEQDETDSDEESVAAPVTHPDDLASDHSEDDDREDPAEAKRRAAFFAPEDNLDGAKPPSMKTGGSFQTMSLSRPIMKGLTAVGFTEPTRIQAKTVPVALLGKDVVGGAVTGSGKTAAFIIPILERLLYRPKKVATTRVAILMPTRELAVQCYNVAKKLASFTDITFAQIVGGFSLREQEQTLKRRPDVVIATPGRFIDHMRNSASFAVDAIEILVLDEADRMLEDGFADELNEILTTIPKSRQTMLFSATMTDSVDKLIRVGLNRPVRLMVDAKKQTVSGLVQEFVRLRPGKEDKRLAYLMYLCSTVYTDRVIIFFRQKREAHRVRVIFSLCGLKASELHGSMSQEQRIKAVESFRSGQSAFLLATDVASRGLDIKNVRVVLNYEAPQTHEIYLHRVGRTARAGRTGRACTLAAEPDRRVVKAAVKSARAQGAKIASRVVPADETDAWLEKLKGFEAEMEAVLKEEKEERALGIAERDMRKGENLVTHEKEIMSRPKRTWFQSGREKVEAQKQGRRELNPEIAAAKMEKRKLSGKEKKRMDARDERKGGRMWKKGKGDSAGAGGKGKSKAKPNGKAKVKKGKR